MTDFHKQDEDKHSLCIRKLNVPGVQPDSSRRTEMVPAIPNSQHAAASLQCSHAFFQVADYYFISHVHFFRVFNMAEMTPVSSSSSLYSVRKRKDRKKKTSCLKKSRQSTVGETVPHIDTSTSCESATPESSAFETELNWCIQMLQLGLLREKVTEVQRKESNHIVKKLSSDKTPMPRKRQIMRSVFGDYRSQMKQKPLCTLPETKEPGAKIECVRKERCRTSGQFFRHSASRSCLLPPTSTVEKETIQPFKFDFV